MEHLNTWMNAPVSHDQKGTSTNAEQKTFFEGGDGEGGSGIWTR